MSGAVQLVATGPQDEWLTGKPEMSYFMTNYRRSTHYANSVERLVVQGKPIDGGFSTVKFDKKGDLLSYVYLTFSNPNGSTAVNIDWLLPGLPCVIDRIELYIGGQLIDTQDNIFLLAVDNPLECRSFNEGKINNVSGSFLPMRFFFCKDWSAALPLVALAFHEVEMRIYWNSVSTTISSGFYPQAWANYIYLDQAERDWFATNTHNMLITQTQRTLTSTNFNQDLPFANSVKYISWPAFHYEENYFSRDVSSYQFKIQINGVDIGESRHLPHWTSVPLYYNVKWAQPYTIDNILAPMNNGLGGLVLISFCLDTSSLQPTGTLNFSRIDSFRIVVPTSLNGGIQALQNFGNYIYAVNYNILRIQDGMGSLLYGC